MDIRTAAQEAIRKAKETGEPIFLVHEVPDNNEERDRYLFETADEITTTDHIETCQVLPTGEIL